MHTPGLLHDLTHTMFADFEGFQGFILWQKFFATYTDSTSLEIDLP